MAANPSKPEDRSRGQRSGEGSLSALRALRRDERRRRNPEAADSILPPDLQPLLQDFLPRTSGG